MAFIKFGKSKINWHKQEQLIKYFVIGSTARSATKIVGINRTTSAYYFHHLREIVVLELEKEQDELFFGEIEVDESYFGGVHKGKRGRGSKANPPVFGLLKRGGKVYSRC